MSRFAWLTSPILFLTVLPDTSTYGSGFVPGEILISTFDSVYSLDPATGQTNSLIANQQFLGDIAFNPVTQSAFILRGNGLQTELLQLRWSAGNGYTVAPFVTGLNGAGGLAVDQSGIPESAEN